jgi:hypothetical protein
MDLNMEFINQDEFENIDDNLYQYKYHAPWTYCGC